MVHQLMGMTWGPSPWVVHAVQCVDVKILALQVTGESGRPQTLYDPCMHRPAPHLPRGQPRLSTGPLTHPLHEALRNAPCTAAAFQLLQELTVGRGKSEGLSCPIVPPGEASRRLGGGLVAARFSLGDVMS